jgi:hypothetical protein
MILIHSQGRRSLVLAAAVFAFGAAGLAHADGAPRFTMSSAVVSATEAPASIVLDGLPAQTELKIVAERIVVSHFLGGQRKRFRSEAVFTSDTQGRLDLATAVPKRGSYASASLQGLFWSMKPTNEAVKAEERPGSVQLLALVGDKTVAQSQLDFAPASAAAQVEAVGAFPGAVFAKPKGASGKLPVLILLGGGEGGSGAARDHAPRLAAMGFAVLGLPYYSPSAAPGGPRELPALPADFINIEIRQLDAVRDWLRKRDDVDVKRIGLYGASKGAEFALLAASHLDWIKAVVAVTPSDVVWEGYGWSMQMGASSSFALDGKPLPFVPYKGFVEEWMRLESRLPVHLRRPHDQGRAANSAKVARARIPVERFRGALLLVAAQDDQLWNSGAMAHNIAERRSEAGLQTELLVYSDAGHNLIGDGWSPTTHYNMGLEQSGGTPEGTARAQIDARPRIAAFLKSAL